ncbi:DMT family transporter [Sphingomonas flavalba]|uniref:DMT family transporter n=1 Tax=Sphingomonas flavalba TaxID=2559804 RepID=UPI0039DF8845
MTITRTDLRAYAMLALVMLFWAGNAIVGRAVRDDIPPFTLALVRWGGALLVVAPFALRHVVADRAVLRRAWRRVLLLGLLGIATFNALLYYGLRFTTATNAMLIQAAIPGLVLLFDYLLFRTRSGWQAIAGVALSTAGVVLIVCRADLQVLMRLDFGTGDLLILAAVVVWGLYTSLLRTRPAVHPSSFIAVTFAIGALAMLPPAIGEWRVGGFPPLRADTLAAFTYVAILPSLVAYFLYNATVAAIGAGRAGQAISLMPLFGAFIAASLLDEALRPFHAAGMVLILVGIVTGAVARSENKQAD